MLWEGYGMVPFNLKVLSKFSLCSNCLQKLEKCPLVCGHKIFATARMLGFSLNFLLYSVSIVCIWETKLILEKMFPVGQTGKRWSPFASNGISNKALLAVSYWEWLNHDRTVTCCLALCLLSCFEGVRLLGTKQHLNWRDITAGGKFMKCSLLAICNF